MKQATTAPPENPTHAGDAPGFCIAVCINLGLPSVPGVPAGNQIGRLLLTHSIELRLRDAGQLLQASGSVGVLNDSTFLLNVREVQPSVIIILETMGYVQLFARIAWRDDREDFWRPVFPEPGAFRPGALIDDALIQSCAARAESQPAPSTNQP